MPTKRPHRVVSRWRRFAGSGSALRPAALFALAGLLAIAASLLPGDGLDDAWVRDLLMGVGGSLALFAPLYFITRSLDSHLDEVRDETRREVAAVRDETNERLGALDAEVSRLGGFSDAVRQALREEAQADRDLFSALRTEAPDLDRLVRALDRAEALRLIAAEQPPRVAVTADAAVYVSFRWKSPREAPLVQFTVEGPSRWQFGGVSWRPGVDARDVFVRLGQTLRTRAGVEEEFDPEALLAGLADLLEVALGSTRHRGAIELCPPQWLVQVGGQITTYGPVPETPHTAPKTNLKIKYYRERMAGFDWVDADSFQRATDVILTLR